MEKEKGMSNKSGEKIRRNVQLWIYSTYHIGYSMNIDVCIVTVFNLRTNLNWLNEVGSAYNCQNNFDHIFNFQNC